MVRSPAAGREPHMSEHAIRGLLDEVRAGRLSRRAFVQSMVSFGLTVPVAGQLLAGAGLAQTSSRPASAPTKRGGGGALKALSWDAPSLLNPILALGLKDWNACALFYEPLVYFDPAGNFVPVLAQDVPSVQNGGVARDGTAVTWKLKHGVAGHDGEDFTAEDVVFTWEYT